MRAIGRLSKCVAMVVVCTGTLVTAMVVPPITPVSAQSEKKPAADGEVAELRSRVQQLEEQLVDIQVVLGTLETLARSGNGKTGPVPSASGPIADGGASAGDDVRMAALETQIRALTAQVQQLSRRGAQSGRLQPQNWDAGRAAAGPAAPSAAPGGAEASAPAAPGGFGSTTVRPGGDDRIGKLITQDRSNELSNRPVAASADGGDPQEAYEAAYGLLLQQDYGAAQTAFSDFVTKHPRHTLAGNAQYWLGETYYVRGQYKSAAGAFLTGYRKFSASAKAPDSLLKLAMSLDRLGQRSAACSSLGELSTKFPSAAAHVKRRASQERSRLRC